MELSLRIESDFLIVNWIYKKFVYVVVGGAGLILG